MSLKPWREIAKPHRDVLEGTFKQSEFAADITQVANGTAPAEYQDAEQDGGNLYANLRVYVLGSPPAASSRTTRLVHQ